MYKNEQIETFFFRFYYDPDTTSCVSFVYSGCGGNGNKFDSMSECLSTCSPSAPANPREMFEVATAFPRRASDCQLPIDPGPCREQVNRVLAFYTVAEVSNQEIQFQEIEIRFFHEIELFTKLFRRSTLVFQ